MLYYTVVIFIKNITGFFRFIMILFKNLWYQYSLNSGGSKNLNIRIRNAIHQ